MVHEWDSSEGASEPRARVTLLQWNQRCLSPTRNKHSVWDRPTADFKDCIWLELINKLYRSSFSLEK